MKVLSTDGLTKLIQLIKSAFISVDDTVTTTTVELADVATTGDYDDLINTPAEVTESTVSGWGFTKNTGTVTSVNNVSPVNGNVTLTADSVLPSQTSQSGKFLTTDGTSTSWATVDALPSQTSQSGKFLTTNGTTASWDNIPTEIPSQSGNSGKFLTTNGSAVSWEDVNDIIFVDYGVTTWSELEDAVETGKTLVCREDSGYGYIYYPLLRSDSSSRGLLFCEFQSGLTYIYVNYNNDTQEVVWTKGTQSVLPSQSGESGKFLTTNGTTASWATVLPSQTSQSGKFLTTDGTTASWGTITIPTVDQTYDATSTNAQSGVAIAGAKFLKNNSSNTAGTSYIIGGTASGVSNTVCIGSGASTAAYSVVVGQGASSTALYSTAVGSTADSNSQFGTAIGYAAKARATSAIQLGTGTNTDANTLFIGFSDAATNYQLLDGTTGLIPNARISTDIARASAIPTESTVSGWGFTKNAGTVTSVNNINPVNGNVTLTIPNVDQTYDSTSANAQSGVAINGAKFLQNTATGTNSLTILGTAASTGSCINIGSESEIIDNGTDSLVQNVIILGNSSKATVNGTGNLLRSAVIIGNSASITISGTDQPNAGLTVIGDNASAVANEGIRYAIALGAKTSVTADRAIQIGEGTNSVEKTLSIGFGSGYNHQLLDGQTGLIPDARISSNIARTSAIPTESTVSGWGFTKNTGTVTSVNNVSPVNGNVSLTIPTVNDATLTIQLNGTTVETFSANASADKTANIQATQVVWRKYTTT